MGEIEPTEFEATLKSLEGLTAAQIAELLTESISPSNAEKFASMAAGLSLDALRLFAARALLRERTLLERRSVVWNATGRCASDLQGTI